jgi:hypothetical protein
VGSSSTRIAAWCYPERGFGLKSSPPGGSYEKRRRR